MKKYFLITFFSVISFSGFSQTKLGLKFSPLLSVNRVATESESSDFSTNGAGGRISFGPVADLFLKENYYFSTGLLYTPKRVGITARGNSDKNNVLEESYSLQYLQLPATLKLFTNELALDKRIYFQVGGLSEIKINEKSKEGNTLVEKFRFFDFSLLVGLGMEYRIGVNTTLFGGLSYSRGLINAASKRGEAFDNFSVKNDLLSLDFGIKF